MGSTAAGATLCLCFGLSEEDVVIPQNRPDLEVMGALSIEDCHLHERFALSSAALLSEMRLEGAGGLVRFTLKPLSQSASLAQI